MSNYGNPPQDPYAQTNPYGAQPPGGPGDTNPYTQGYGEPADYPGGPQGPSRKGFFASLFDFSFSSFITPMVVKLVYILSVIGLGLTWLFFTIAGFVSDSPAVGLLFLVVGAFMFLLYLCFIRMTLEFYVAIVRMSEDIHQRLR
ncbi:DUF4282 domain-containing protein [Nocardioides sp. 616]|uniref:DUF4282 domain-containing protein n=1 Tax=Nocardioides sp. 616 TaxID=2268090 RepID=UPI000CE321D5|nr:DUF4282 domain-containing protein [Nocardioides sp. 616]